MAKKKLINEATNGTPAMDSLRPDSNRTDGPTNFDMTRSEKLAKIVAVCGGISDEDINKFMESMAQIGNEAKTNPQGNRDGNLASITPGPSAALGHGINVKTPAIKEDLQKLFGEQHTPEFIETTTKIFEAALDTRLIIERQQLTEEFETKLEEAYDELSTAMVEKVDEYLNYAVNEWIEENKVVLENSLKQDVTEEFIEGLKGLFAEHYIEVPDEKVDVVKQLEDRVQALEKSLNDKIQENINLTKSTVETEKTKKFNQVAEGLNTTQTERLKVLAEQIAYTTPEEFETKVKMLKETAFKPESTKTVKKTGLVIEEVALSEEDVAKGDQEVVNDPNMRGYVEALSRLVKKH